MLEGETRVAFRDACKRVSMAARLDSDLMAATVDAVDAATLAEAHGARVLAALLDAVCYCLAMEAANAPTGADDVRAIPSGIDDGNAARLISEAAAALAAGRRMAAADALIAAAMFLTRGVDE